MVFHGFDNCRPCSGDSTGDATADSIGIDFHFLDEFRPARMEGPGQAVFSPGCMSFGGPRIVIMILPEVPSYYSMPSGGPDRVIDFRRLRGCPGWSSDNFGSPYDGIPRLIMDLIAMSARGSQESWLDPSRQNQGWPIGGWQGNWQKVAPQDNWRSGYGMPPALARELASRAHRTGEQAWRNTPPGQTGGRWRADYGVAPGLAEELSRRAQQTREQAWRNTRPGQTGGRWRADYGVAPGIGNDLADRDLQNKLEAWYLRRRN